MVSIHGRLAYFTNLTLKAKNTASLFLYFSLKTVRDVDPLRTNAVTASASLRADAKTLQRCRLHSRKMSRKYVSQNLAEKNMAISRSISRIFLSQQKLKIIG